MKYCNGFPQTMVVGENGVTLHDLERAMLSLYWDKELNDGDKEFVMERYKEERMRHLDGLFAFTEENRQRLEEVEWLYLEAVRRMDGIVDRMAMREARKKEQGRMAAGFILANLEIGNLEDTPDHGYSDEEMDLWGVSCGEDRQHLLFWGVRYRTVYVDDYGKDRNMREQPHRPRTAAADPGAEACLGRDFRELKDSRKLAWGDLMRITGFDLTVRLRY